jgi:hypothetical protein
VPTLLLCVLYGSQNKQQLLPYKTLRDWFLQPKWRVFTARYALSPYIKQIRFVFSGLKQSRTVSSCQDVVYYIWRYSYVPARGVYLRPKRFRGQTYHETGLCFMHVKEKCCTEQEGQSMTSRVLFPGSITSSFVLTQGSREWQTDGRWAACRGLCWIKSPQRLKIASPTMSPWVTG